MTDCCPFPVDNNYLRHTILSPPSFLLYLEDGTVRGDSK
jgi:hypothetical protein